MEKSLSAHLDSIQQGIQGDPNEPDVPLIKDGPLNAQDEHVSSQSSDVSADVISKEDDSRDIFRAKKQSFSLKWVVLVICLIAAGAAGWFYKDSIAEIYEEYAYSTDNYSESNDLQEHQKPMTRGEVMALLRQFSAEVSAQLDRDTTASNNMSFLKDKARYDKLFKRQDVEIGALADQVRKLTALIKPNMPGALSEDKFIARLGALQGEINAIRTEGRAELNKINQGLSKTTKLAKKLKENEWGLHKRLKVLERNIGIRKPLPAKEQKVTRQVGLPPQLQVARQPSTKASAKSKQVRLNYPHRWKLKIASNAFTQIRNVDSNQLLRLSPGVDVPGCGHVVKIDVVGRKVMTEQCVIRPQVTM